MSIELYLDELQRFADQEFHTELLATRVEYFAGLGQVNEDDDLFEAYLDRFLEWFIFERILPQTGQTPLASFIARRCETAPPETLRVYEGFAKGVHGIFEVRKSSKNAVELRELLTKEKYTVEDEVPGAFTKGQIFEARLLPLGDKWYFSKGYIFHPMPAAKAIQKRLKALESHGPEALKSFIRDLAIRRLKADRYKHVEPENFYKF
jgi:hypothetical protein